METKLSVKQSNKNDVQITKHKKQHQQQQQQQEKIAGVKSVYVWR